MNITVNVAYEIIDVTVSDCVTCEEKLLVEAVFFLFVITTNLGHTLYLTNIKVKCADLNILLNQYRFCAVDCKYSNHASMLLLEKLHLMWSLLILFESLWSEIWTTKTSINFFCMDPPTGI